MLETSQSLRLSAKAKRSEYSWNQAGPRWEESRVRKQYPEMILAESMLAVDPALVKWKWK